MDDDQEVHEVTRLTLLDLVLNDRNLEFYHAYSQNEAREIIVHIDALDDSELLVLN